MKTAISKTFVSLNPVFRWYYNGVQIQSSEKTQILNETHRSTLVINCVQENDSGIYDCSVVTASKEKLIMKSSCTINIGSKYFYF